MPIAIQTNIGAAYRLFDRLLHAQAKKLPPYDQVESVQGPKVLPSSLEWGSPAHARFLFNTCYYMRGKIDSGTAIISLGKLFTTEGWMFESDAFRGLNGDSGGMEEKIKTALQKNGLGFSSDEVSRFWVYNSRKLAEHWDGSPSSFYTVARDYDELCQIFFHKKLHNETTSHGFFGFRHKMVSMYTYFLEDAGIISPFMYPVPVDFHILRVLVAHGALYGEEMYPGVRLSVDRLSKAARVLTTGYCLETGAKALDLANALWHLSREFCRESPSNSSTVSKEYRGRRTAIVVKDVLWTQSQERRAHRTCGRCAVADTCNWAIPSANYYVQGVIVVRGSRDKPLDLFAR